MLSYIRISFVIFKDFIWFGTKTTSVFKISVSVRFLKLVLHTSTIPKECNIN